MLKELLEKLMATVDPAKTEDAKNLLEQINSEVAKIDGEVMAKESKLNDAVKERDTAKEKLREIATKAGVDVEAENWKEELAKVGVKTGKADEEAQRRIDQLQGEIDTMKTARTELKAAHAREMLGLTLDKEIATLLPKHKAKGSAGKFIIDEVRRKATFEDGKVVFKAENGTKIRIDGRDMTAEDVIVGMREAEKKSGESMFFDISPQASGAGDGDGGKVVEGDYNPSK